MRKRSAAKMQTGYKIGYGRPPAHSHFKKGVSGNPKGRPKGVKDIGSMFAKIVNKKITVREDGQQKEITKLEAVIHATVNRGMTGDHRSFGLIMEMAEKYKVFEPLLRRLVVEFVNSNGKGGQA